MSVFRWETGSYQAQHFERPRRLRGSAGASPSHLIQFPRLFPRRLQMDAVLEPLRIESRLDLKLPQR